MKRHVLPILFATVLLLLSLMPFAFAAPETGIKIQIAKNADETEQAAAETLQTYLKQITGVLPEIVSSADAAGQRIVLLLRGDDAAQRKGGYLLRAGFDENHKALTENDSAYYIDAADARGLWNGVFGFLRRVCGVEIYSADVKTVPTNENLTLPASDWYVYTPTLEYADTDWISPGNLDFALAYGLNGLYSPLESVHGGKVRYHWFCHSLTGGIVPKKELFETHPEYFALTENSGEREPQQLCLSNPEVVERAKQDVMRNLDENYDPKAALNIVSVTQADNQDYCICENCTAIAEQYGGQSGLMLWFVNQIAETVEEKYPDVVVDTFAYQYTRHAPKGIRPRDNVCVRLCSIECCFSHALEDPACEQNAEFMKDLRDWSAISKRLYVWDYVTNFIQTIGIFPNFGVLRQNIDTFRNHNVVGIYEEGNYYASSCNAEFADLRAYLLSCDMQNELTAEEEAAKRNDFLKAYYCEGAEEVGEFLDYITAHAGNDKGHLHIYDSMEGTLHGVSAADVKRMDALWNAAIEQATDAGNTDAVQRLERSRLSWRYYEACLGVGEFRGLLPEMRNNKAMAKLIWDLSVFDITRYNEGNRLEEVNPVPYLSPNQWSKDRHEIYPAAMACAAALLLTVLATVIVALKKRHRVCALLLLVLGVDVLISGAWQAELFIHWDQLVLYSIVDAAMLLGVAGFGMITAWARNRETLRGKRLVIALLVSLAAAAAPYELIVLLVNTVILKSQKPVLAMAICALWQMAVIFVNLILTLFALLKKETTSIKPKKEKECGV